MSLIYTEGYLESMPITSIAQKLEPNIKSILIVPPKNNIADIIFYIYEYDKYHPIYKIHLLKNEIFLEGLLIKKDFSYNVKADGGEVRLYYNKEVD